MIFNLVVFVLAILSFVVQEFIPPFMGEYTYYARLNLPAVFFFAASVAVPFPSMLVLALLTGFIWDARYLPMPAGGSDLIPADMELGVSMAEAAGMSAGDLQLGYSVIIFGLMGVLMQGVRPLFKRGRLELPVIMVGFATAAWLLVQYLLITLLRGDFYLYFPTPIWLKLGTGTMYAMLVSPLVFLVLHILARVTQYEIKYEGLRYSFNGR